MPETPCDLAPEILGTLHRDGYAIERLTFQSRPGVRVTANLYRPEPANARHPALLSVHGHWAWARIDEHVQPRCIALAKRGYVVLCVDAFGAGERAITPAAGTYHGGLLGASLWPTGVSLMGLQVYDNRRAVDYLVSRPEVDAERLAITGASGGGNQTLYAGATDDRFKAVVPVCGIGRFENYIESASCVCEVNLGGLTYATTGDVLALVAPRALLVINASRDALQFSPGEAKKSLDYARERYRLLDHPEKIGQVVIESGHDYNQPMREALYGWLDRWLKGAGDGSPVSEPKVTVEDPATLRCYPDGQSRPRTIVTVPQFALAEGKARVAALPGVPDHRQRWAADADRMKAQLRDQILGGFPDRTPLNLTLSGAASVEIESEPALRVAGEFVGTSAAGGVALVLALEGCEQRQSKMMFRDRVNLHVELRATGRGKPATPVIAGAADHNEAEWGLWIGRPLLGQWVWDVIRWLDALDELRTQRRPFRDLPAQPCTLIGIGPMGLVAMLAGAFDQRVTAVGVENPLISLVSEGPWANVPMGILAPGILDVGDIGHLAALLAPKPLVVAGGVEPTGRNAFPERVLEAFSFARGVYSLLEADQKFTFTTGSLAPELRA
jgi:dienelactone hydrolase